MRNIRALATALLLSNLCSAAKPKGPFSGYVLPHAISTPCDMDTGPDGETLWFQDVVAAQLSVLNVKTQLIKTFDIPWGRAATPNGPPGIGNYTLQKCFVRTGQDGMIYFASAYRSELGQVNPKTFKFAIYENSSPVTPQNINEGFAGKDGLYFTYTNGNDIGYFDYAKKTITVTSVADPQSGPFGIHTDSAGNLWVTLFYANKIVKIGGGKTSVYQLPSNVGANPASLRAFTNNRYLWTNSFSNGTLIRIDTKAKGNPLKFFGTASDGIYPDQNTNDSENNVWTALEGVNLLEEYNPTAGTFTTLAIPGGGVDPRSDLPVHYGPLNAIWTVATDPIELLYHTLS